METENPREKPQPGVETEELIELNRAMCALSLTIQNRRLELAELEANYMLLWKQKQTIQRTNIRIHHLPPHKRKRSLSSIPLDELPEYLSSLSPSDLADAMEELMDIAGD